MNSNPNSGCQYHPRDCSPSLRLRLGLCCQFAREPIKFRTTTVTAMLCLSRPERLARLAELCLTNADALLASLRYCAAQGIGAFRINSQILPLRTHPAVGYSVADLPNAKAGSMPFLVEIANGSARYATFSSVPFA